MLCRREPHGTVSVSVSAEGFRVDKDIIVIIIIHNCRRFANPPRPLLVLHACMQVELDCRHV